MYRTFSIRQSLLCAARQFKKNFLFFAGFSVLWGAAGLLVMIGLNYLRLPEGLMFEIFDVVFSLANSFLFLWLLVALTYLAMRLHKDMAVSYRDLFMSPRIIVMGVLTLFVIGFAVWAISSLVKMPILLNMVSLPNDQGFHVGRVIQLISIAAVGAFLARVILSLFIVVDTQGAEINPIWRSMMLTQGNTFKLMIVCAFVAFLPLLVSFGLQYVMYYMFNFGFGYLIVGLFSNMYALFILAPLLSALSTLWFVYSILIISHIYKQLHESDDAQAAMPSAFIN